MSLVGAVVGALIGIGIGGPVITALTGVEAVGPAELIGCLIIGVLNSGLVLLNVSPFWQQVVKGGVILIAVAIDRLRETSD